MPEANGHEFCADFCYCQLVSLPKSDSRFWFVRSPTDLLVIPKNDLRSIKVSAASVTVTFKDCVVLFVFDTPHADLAAFPAESVFGFLTDPPADNLPPHTVTIRMLSTAADASEFFRGSLKSWILLTLAFVFVMLLVLLGLIQP
jgi:hypothetical protein